MATLYRKYRPQTFAQVVGQEHIVRTLQNALAQGQVAHAYLFAGPRGTGKTTLARLLAKAVSCKEGPRAESCLRCPSCQGIEAGRSLDLIEIDAASNRGIDEIRELREKVKYPPHQAKYKVYIIDEVHMLTREAFNALLKTLEEPPAQVIFILATTELAKVPETILSRCQVFAFHKLSQSQLVEKLKFICAAEKVKVEPEALRLTAARAGGAMRDAESLLGQLFAYGEKEITLAQAREVLGVPDLAVVAQLSDLILQKETAKLLALVNTLLFQGKTPQNLADALCEYLRRVLIIKVNPALAENETADLTEEQAKRLAQQSQAFDLATLSQVLVTLNQVGQETDKASLPQLPLELALIALNDSNKGKLVEQSQAAGTETLTLTAVKINPVLEKPRPGTKPRPVKAPASKPMAADSTKKISVNRASLKSICADWAKVVAAVSEYQKPLGALLRLCQPLSLEEGYLTLALKYAFHKEQVANHPNRLKIEEILEQVYGQKIRLKVVILDNLEPVNVEEVGDRQENDDTVDQALRVLGGKIVK